MELSQVLRAFKPTFAVDRQALGNNRDNAGAEGTKTRQAMYKSRATKAKVDMKAKRKDKRHELANKRRGIDPGEFSDDTGNEENTACPKKPSLQRRLEEFRRQKQMKKVADAKNKKPPFVVGKVHYAAPHIELAKVSGFKTPGRGVFHFKGKQESAKATTGVRITRSKAARMAAQPHTAVTPGVVKKNRSKEPSADKKASSSSQTPESSPKAEEGRLGWGKTPESSPKQNVQPLGWGKTPESSPKETFKTPEPLTKRTPPKISLTTEEHEESRDQLMPITPLSLAKLKSGRRTPGLSREVANLYDRFRSEVCFERGSYSDRKKKQRQSLANPDIKTIEQEMDEIVIEMQPKHLTFEEPVSVLLQPPSGEKVTDKVSVIAKHKQLVIDTKQNLQNFCDKWNSKMLGNDENIDGQIRVAIGKAQILMGGKGRIQQFEQLIENCEFDLGEKKTKESDLIGFWDMIHFQVENVEKEFEKLARLEKNGWKEEEEERAKTQVKKRVKKKPVAPKGPSSGLRAAMAAKRKALTEKPNDLVVFEGGFFNIQSPAKKPEQVTITLKTPSTPKCNKVKSNPTTPLLVMCVTKAARRSIAGDVCTPKFSANASCTLGSFETMLSPFQAKPDRKTPRRSTMRKSVLLGDDLISFETPSKDIKVRRSARLSGVKKDYKC